MNCTNSFVSDGKFYYHSAWGQKCYNTPIEACQNPQRYVDITNGNAELGYCNSIQVTESVEDDGPVMIYFEGFEMKKSIVIPMIIDVLLVLIIMGIIIYLK